MDKVSECLDSLVLEMQESKEYQNYLWMEQEISKDPELKRKIDDYRIRNYRLQQRRMWICSMRWIPWNMIFMI